MAGRFLGEKLIESHSRAIELKAVGSIGLIAVIYPMRAVSERYRIKVVPRKISSLSSLVLGDEENFLFFTQLAEKLLWEVKNHGKRIE